MVTSVRTVIGRLSCLVPGLMEAIKPGESADGGTKEAP